MKKSLLVTIFISIFALSGGVYAGGKGDHSHGHEDMGAMSQHDNKEMGMSHSDKEMFLEKHTVDGYEVSFHVMEAQPGMGHGGSHNFMVKIEKGGKALQDVKINSKVVHPNGDSETKPLMKMGGWFMNGYDLEHAGKHQLMILFKTADGNKHKAGVYYNN